MNHFAHLLDANVHSLQGAIIAVAVLAWLVIAAITVRARGSQPVEPKWPPPSYRTAAILVFVGIIGGEFAIGGFIRSAALNEIRPKLAGGVQTVMVDNAPFDKPEALLASLRSMGSPIAHHSHPTTVHQLLILGSHGRLAFHLGRDSADPHEYWVFYDGFESTKQNDVGHIFTDVLDR
jgi:hypothetical protein